MCVAGEIGLLFGKWWIRCSCNGVEALLAEAGLADLWGLP